MVWLWLFVSATPLWFFNRPYDPENLQIPSAMKAEASSPYRVIQFSGPILEEWRRDLEARGVVIYGYVKDYGYIVRVPEGVQRSELFSGLPIVADLPYHPVWKIEPEIGTRTFEHPERVADDRWWLAVDAFPDADLFRVVDALEKAGAWVETWVETPPPIVVKRVWVRIPKDRRVLEALARIPEVWMIRERLEYKVLNDRNRWVLQGNVETPMDTSVWANGIHGEGQIIAVMDSDLNENACWFSGKTISNAPAPGSPTGTVDYCAACEHGHHVAGTALGRATGADAAYNGMAYEAQLIFQDIQAGCGSAFLDVPSSLIQAFTDAYNQGARVHTNSWGSSTNSYTTYAQEFDDFLFTNQDMIFTIAMGNSSSSTASEDGTIGSPATAKNVISVGSTNKPPDQDTRAWYSSQGPTYDGRMKPEVMAPGGDASANETNSADESVTCGVCQMSGTSMATPAVAGVAALVRQYFVDGYYPSGAANAADGFNPLGSLVKAVLVAAAEPMASEPPIPNSEIGWGRIRLRNVLYFQGDTFKLFVVNAENGPTTGQTLTYTINVDNTRPLIVALAWYDAAGQNLVNNLDLEVVDPNGTVYRGNVFSNGWSTTGGTADAVNTVEGVRIQNPVAGTWTIRVIGTNVPTPASAPYSGQPFGLVAVYKELPPVNAPAIVVTPPDTVFMNALCKGVQDSIEVRNVGTQTLDVTSITTTQDPRLIIDGPTTFSLNQNQSQWVRFRIDTAGLVYGRYYKGDLIIHSNDPDPQDNPYTVWVKLALPHPYDPATDYGPDSLEANDGGWVSNDPTNGFAWGTPPANPGARSGSNVWGVGLSGSYTNSVNTTLEKTFYRNYYCGTPFFVIWHWYDMENGYDGGNVKYSLDGGTTWSILTPRRGYDGSLSTSWGNPIGGEQAFTGTSGGWISDTFDLTALSWNKEGAPVPVELLAQPGDSILIRFHFGSDNSITSTGWYIDDIQAVGLSPTPVLPMDTTVAAQVGESSRLSGLAVHLLSPPVTRGELRLSLTLPRGGKVDVNLFDASGRRVRNLFRGFVGAGTQEIRTRLRLVPGIYFLRIQIDKRHFERRIVITG